jgi:hypothetical protein
VEKKVKAIPISKWEWSGHAGHFCASDSCKFRLHTKIGNYVISTVGEYVCDGEIKEIGCDRKYESYVFEVTNKKHKCGCYVIEKYEEIDSLPANDSITAHANHMKLCFKWAKL